MKRLKPSMALCFALTALLGLTDLDGTIKLFNEIFGLTR